MTTRIQKRWSARLRTAGALLALVGAVAIVDVVLPGKREWMFHAGAQIAVGAGALAIGLLLFVVGRSWR